MLAKIDSGCVGFKYIIMKRNKGMGRKLRQRSIVMCKNLRVCMLVLHTPWKQVTCLLYKIYYEKLSAHATSLITTL